MWAMSHNFIQAVSFTISNVNDRTLFDTDKEACMWNLVCGSLILCNLQGSMRLYSLEAHIQCNYGIILHTLSLGDADWIYYTGSNV